MEMIDGCHSNIRKERKWKVKRLVFNLKREWYDLIASGEKKVYRAVNDYWMKRLTDAVEGPDGVVRGEIRHFDEVVFRLGYSGKHPDIVRKITGIDIGPCPYEGWNGEYFRIRFSGPDGKSGRKTSGRSVDRTGRLGYTVGKSNTRKRTDMKGSDETKASASGRKYPKPPEGSRMWKHAEGKRQHSWWCRDGQWDRISAKAAELGRNVSSMLVGIADGELDVVEAKP